MLLLSYADFALSPVGMIAWLNDRLKYLTHNILWVYQHLLSFSFNHSFPMQRRALNHSGLPLLRSKYLIAFHL